MSISEQISLFSGDSKWNELFNLLHDENLVNPIDLFLEKEYQTYGEHLQIFPPPQLIFNSLQLMPFNKLKVCIIGQDPYHEKDQAMGLSFSVPKSCKIPPSLVNIYKEISNDVGEDFQIPNHGDLTEWAEQGVLLLNASLTVREHCANSHSKHWQNFTNTIIKYISDKCDKIVFLLWGNFAKNKSKFIDSDKHIILTSSHPSPLSANRGGWFGCKHFTQTNDILKNNNLEAINWNLSK